MKYEIKLWENIDYTQGRHLCTLIVEVGTIYDDWETARTDPRKFVIGKEGKGIARLKDHGSLYLYEHIFSSDILLLNNWTQPKRNLSVGMQGFGVIYKTRSRHWNETRFISQVTRKFAWYEAGLQKNR